MMSDGRLMDLEKMQYQLTLWKSMVAEDNIRHKRDLDFINQLIKVIEDNTDLKWWEEI